jgi:hypothetical protein
MAISNGSWAMTSRKMLLMTRGPRALNATRTPKHTDSFLVSAIDSEQWWL